MRSTFGRRAVTLGLSIFTASCGLPRDPEKTSERIASTHELRVGFTSNAPWTDGSGAEPQGIEPDLVRRFAATIGAHVAWTTASETNLTKALNDHQLDLVIGGFEKKTLWSAQAGVSQPFAVDSRGNKHVILAAPGENRFILTLDRYLTNRKPRATS